MDAEEKESSFIKFNIFILLVSLEQLLQYVVRFDFVDHINLHLLLMSKQGHCLYKI